MDSKFDLLSIFGEGIFTWILSKFLDKGLDWLNGKKYSQKDIFGDIVENIIDRNPNLDLTKESFTDLFTDINVCKNLKLFEDGEEELDVKNLVAIYNKIAFGDRPEQLETATKIISDLIEEIKYLIFNNPDYTNRFLYSIVNTFKKSTAGYATNILSRLSSLEKQLVGGVREIKVDNEFTHNKLAKMEDLLVKTYERLPNSKNDLLNAKIKIANNLMNNGKIISARNIYLEILGSVENDEKELLWKLNSNIGKSYINDFNETESIKYLISAYEIYPTEEKGLIQLALAYLFNNKITEGIETTDQILKINPLSKEAIIIKSNLLVKDNKCDKAIEILQNQELNNFDICYTYGYTLGKAKKYPEAKVILTKALEYQRSPMALDLLAITTLEPVINELQNIRPITINKSSNQYLELNEALEYLNESIEKWEQQEIKMQKAVAHMNRGLIYSLLKEKDKCFNDYKISEHLGLNDEMFFRNMGICYIERGEYEQAIIYFSKAIEGGDINSKEHLLNCMILSNNFTEAKKIVLKNVNGSMGDMTEDNFYYYVVLSEIKERELLEHEAEGIIELLYEKYPKDIRVVNRLVEYRKNKGAIEEAIDILERYSKELSSGKDIITVTLADFYFDLKKFEKAAENYELLVNRDHFGYIEKKYLYSLINSGKHSEVIKLIDELEPFVGLNNEELNKLKGEIFLFYERFQETKEIFKKLATNYRKVEYYVKWGLSEFRLGEFEIAEKILNSGEKDFIDKHKELLRISSAYSMIGKTEKALDLAFEIVQRLPDDLDANNNFLFIFLNHTQQNPELIVEEKKKELFKNTLNSFEQKFPGNTNWRKMHIDDNFEEIKKTLKEQESFIKHIHELYDFHKLPLSIVAGLIQRNIYITWSSFLSDTRRKIWAYNPNYAKTEFNLIKDYSDKVILDPVSFFTLYAIGRLDLLSNFSAYYFPQRLLDILISEISHLKMSMTTGIMNLYSFEGQLYKNQISPLDVEKNIKMLIEMVNIVRGKTIGYDINVNKPDYEQDEVFKFIDDATKQSLLYALNNDIPIMLDDSGLLELFINKYKIEAFSSLTLLRLSRSKNKITTQEYNSLVLKLVSGNYLFISISADIIKQCLQANNFDMSFSSQYLIQYLNQPDIDERSVAIVLGDLFIFLYSANISPIKQDAWLDYSLDCLPRNKLNTTVLLRIIYERIQSVYVGVIEYNEVLRWLDVRLRSWAFTRCVPYFK